MAMACVSEFRVPLKAMDNVLSIIIIIIIIVIIK